MTDASGAMTAPSPVKPWGRSDLAAGALLDERAARDGDFPYLRFEGRTYTVGEIASAADRLAGALAALGIGRGDHVAVMLPNHPEHVIVFFALLKLGAVQSPVNVHLRGQGLRFILSHFAPKAIVADAAYAEHLDPILPELPLETAIWRGREGADLDLARLIAAGDAAPRGCRMAPDDVAAILYTSGTTGLPKGVMLTDRMLRCAAHASERLTEPSPGDVLYVWEPLYHIGGVEVMILAVQEPLTLAMVERFSVSRFWGEVRAFGATHIHFLGGVLALLLKEPPRPDDRDHPVRIAWGGGCPAPVWRAFQERFGVAIRECYGMTEASSFTTQNLEGVVGSVGRPVPWFEVRIVDPSGAVLGPGERGEIVVRSRTPGLITPGYFRNPEATAAALRDGWLHTGDVGWFDDDGLFYFAGRLKDSIRRRGENITAFEIERAANEHPAVAESAVIGVPNEIADEDVKIFLRLKPGCALDPAEFLRWCEPRMARFQIPRYVAFIDAMPRTATERIRKEALPRDVAGVFDAEAARARGRG